MPRYLALDWDHNQLLVVAATVSAGGVRIQRAAVWPEDQSPNLAEAESLGKRLRERLKGAGIAPAPVLACIARDRLILKEARIPPVPEHEEPALVRFQAVKDLVDPPDEVVIDYALAEDHRSGVERLAQVFILRRELLQAYQALCKSAGLKLLGLTPRSFGSVACFWKVAGTTVLTPLPDSVERPVAILTVAERRAEFCVARGQKLLLSRGLVVGPGLSGEIRRNLTFCNSRFPQQSIRTLYVAGGDALVLRDQLQESLGILVHPLDPFGGAEGPHLPGINRGAFLGAVGLLHLQADKSGLPVNLARPKQPRPPRDPNKPRLLAGLGLAAALLLGIVGYSYIRLTAANKEYQALLARDNELRTIRDQLELDAQRIKALDEWAALDINWLDELYDLTDRFPDPTTTRLVQLSAGPLTRTLKGKHVARMELKGVTGNDHRPVDDLMSEFLKDGHYRLDPKVLSRNTGPDRFRGFTQQFATKLDVEKVPPTKYIRLLSVAPPERQREPERPAAGMNLGFAFPGGGQP